MTRAVCASALGGALYFLGYLGFGYWPLLAIFLLPFWWALERSGGVMQAFGCGFVFGVVAYLGGHDWLLALVDVFLEGNRGIGWGLFGAYGVWFALAFGLYGAAFRWLRDRGIGFVAAAIPGWVVLEWLHPLLFPVHVGAGWIDVTPLVQVADLGGPLLLSLQLVLLNAASFSVMQAAGNDRHRGETLRLVVVVVCVFVGSAFYGVMRENTFASTPDAASLRVGIVQANLGTLEKRRQAAAGHRAHLALSRELLEREGPIDLLVWPETAYVRAIAGPLPVSGALIRQGFETPLLLGAPVIEGGSGNSRQLNAALLIERDGMIRNASRKTLLIPLAGEVPFAAWLPGLAEALPHAQSFAASDTTNALTFDDTRIAVPICYEAVRPRFVRRLVNESEANLIVTLANDAWFGTSREPRLHLQLARLRAIEHRRYLVRATNSGISAIIDPSGRVVESTGVLERATLSGQVSTLDDTTAYARWGDWPGPLATAWILGAAVWRRRRMGSSVAAGSSNG